MLSMQTVPGHPEAEGWKVQLQNLRKQTERQKGKAMGEEIIHTTSSSY